MNYIEISLSDRDQYLYQIEGQIEAKRNLLLNKRKYLENITKENKFLEGVRNDYQKYNRIIVKQKEDQLKAMGMLKQYIDDIIVSGKLTEEDIKQSKMEQQNILKEIEEIKKNLEEFV